MKLLDEAVAVAKKIGIPLNEWAGNCYGIVTAMIEQGIMEGESVYGHYHGPIDSESLFKNRIWTQHGWIIQKDGTIVDPTRWVFENGAPYIYRNGPGEKNDREYDRGGNRIRNEFRRPMPQFSKKLKPLPKSKKLKFDTPETEAWVRNVLDEPPSWTYEQLHWLATMDPKDLGPSAEPVYSALVGAGLGALIPIDNRRMILGEN
jgi:hypothetical protein